MKCLRLLSPVLCVVLVAACSMLDKPKQDKHVPQGTVSVKVTAKGGENVPIFLASYPAGSAKPLSTYRVKNGSVTGFLLPANQTYEFRAFVDKDGNGQPGTSPVGSIKGVQPDTDVHAQSQVIVLEIPEAGAVPAAAAKPGAASAPPASLDIDKFDAPKKADSSNKGAAPEVPPAPKN